jgi:alanyl-tRNA synthetase
MTAVSGDEAAKLQKAAGEYSARLELLKTKVGGELESALKDMGKDIDSAYIPYLAKNDLRNSFAIIKKQFDDAEKHRKALEMKIAVEKVKKHFENNPDSKYLIAIVSETGNSKALSAAIVHVKSLDKAALFLSLEGDNINIQATVPKVYSESGCNAVEWAKSVIIREGVEGGRVGGSSLIAQGSGSLSSNMVQSGISLAENFASLHLK